MYNINKPTSHITYLDANNLYGYSIMQPISTKILDWVNPKDFILGSYSNNSSIGCFLEADYPDWLTWWITWFA